MSKLVLALHKQQMDVANSLWPTVLSFEFWQLPVSTVWQLSWQVDATADKNWTQVLLADSACRRAALLFLSLAARVETDSCEQMLDYLIGNEPVVTGEAVDSAVSSPLKDFYINDETASEYPTLFYQTLSHLTVLRAKLREYQATLSEALRLPDLISFVELYEEAGERMLNTSPYNQQKEAVQLMTAFKAKGLEFGHVFVVCCQDDVWGGSSRGNSNRISLPPNLQPIRYAGATDDERLRIFFVALTRAKQGLHLTSFTQTFNGKKSRRLKYMQEVEQEDGSFKCTILPEQAQSIMQNDLQAPELALLQLDWQSRHLPDSDNTQLAGLLSERLSQFALSPTHFNTFLDTQYGGPQEFFFRAILRFPHAPTINGIFGSAIHETLEWVQQQVNSASMPAQKQIEQYFSEVLKRQHLTSDNLKLETGRGVKALRTYMASRGPGFKAGNKPEYNFRSDHIMPGNIRLTGKIDLLEIDSKKKKITVVDYKTGNSYSSWKSDAKLHKYRQQLYFYKLLIEGSPSFSGYKVTAGRLEFIEPDNHGVINSLTMDFKPDELNHTKDLIKAVWKRIMALDFPDISDYEKTLTGIKAFESSLLAKSKA
jgi:DNA helicase-2/ATP-dependent DNA helicase PcrA